VLDFLHLRGANICPAQLNSLSTAALPGKGDSGKYSITLWLQNKYFNKVNLLTHIWFLRF